MARIVMKFGGTSMAGTERIRRVAQIVKRQADGGHEVAVAAGGNILQDQTTILLAVFL